MEEGDQVTISITKRKSEKKFTGIVVQISKRCQLFVVYNGKYKESFRLKDVELGLIKVKINKVAS
ncbi:MAG: hypothetical protein VR72_02930 [Clostridiaceae bacterium BRH_c20a]|nr:MAG: hypothetical protein VR72_02930 [Clostridiaceae bacterium BRH_c20a]